MSFRISPQAEADLDAIWYYVATESASIDIADRLLDTITSRFTLLAYHPFAGRSRDREFGAGIRSFPASEYVIVYAVDGELVSILRVVHGRRDLEFIFYD